MGQIKKKSKEINKWGTSGQNKVRLGAELGDRPPRGSRAEEKRAHQKHWTREGTCNARGAFAQTNMLMTPCLHLWHLVHRRVTASTLLCSARRSIHNEPRPSMPSCERGWPHLRREGVARRHAHQLLLVQLGRQVADPGAEVGLLVALRVALAGAQERRDPGVGGKLCAEVGGGAEAWVLRAAKAKRRPCLACHHLQGGGVDVRCDACRARGRRDVPWRRQCLANGS